MTASFIFVRSLVDFPVSQRCNLGLLTSLTEKRLEARRKKKEKTTHLELDFMPLVSPVMNI